LVRLIMTRSLACSLTNPIDSREIYNPHIRNAIVLVEGTIGLGHESRLKPPEVNRLATVETFSQL